MLQQGTILDNRYHIVSADLMTRQFFTATGMAMGTVRYMAPEQLEGVRDDPRVDIYALGALLYEM
ncbi:MAG: serine/threonine protein kinase, partial [Anaerolineae bacterium]